MQPETIVAIIGALTSLVVAFVALRKSSTERAAAKADAAATLTDSAAELIEILQVEVKRLRDRVDALETKAQAQIDVIKDLQTKLEAAEKRIAALERENEWLKTENQLLRERWRETDAVVAADQTE